MSKYFPGPDEGGKHTIFPGVHIHSSGGDELMLVVVDLEPHSVVEEHSHPHEQMGILLEGSVIFTIGGETKTLMPGDRWRIPGNVKHKVVTLDQRARAIDIFHPVRKEYC